MYPIGYDFHKRYSIFNKNWEVALHWRVLKCTSSLYYWVAHHNYNASVKFEFIDKFIAHENDSDIHALYIFFNLRFSKHNKQIRQHCIYKTQQWHIWGEEGHPVLELKLFIYLFFSN